MDLQHAQNVTLDSTRARMAMETVQDVQLTQIQMVKREVLNAVSIYTKYSIRSIFTDMQVFTRQSSCGPQYNRSTYYGITVLELVDAHNAFRS